MRAQFLGSTAITILARCACGRRGYYAKAFWARRGYVICDQCKGFILYHSLEVKAKSWEGYMAVETDVDADELEALRGIEQELRKFVEKFGCYPEWQWAPATCKMVRAVEPYLEKLDGERGEKKLAA